MKTEAVYPSISYQSNTTVSPSPLQRFIAWAEGKQSERLSYLAGMLIIHGNLTAPLALYSMFLVDGGLLQLILITIASFAILVVNLAALPTKITIPTYIACTGTVLLMILANFIMAFI